MAFGSEEFVELNIGSLLGFIQLVHGTLNAFV